MNLKEVFTFNPWRFCLALLLQIIGAVVEIVFAYFLTLQFNAIRNHNLRMFAFFTALQLGCYILVYVSDNIAGIIWQKHIQSYLHLIRQELTDHYFLDGKKYHVASVQNRLTNDLNLLHNDYLNSFRYIAGMIVSVCSVALTLLTFQWSLLIACLILAIMQVYLPKLIDKQLQKATSRVSNTNKRYLKSLSDWLIGLSELYRYLAGQKLFEVLAKKAKALEDAKVDKEKVDQKLDYLNQLVYSGGDILILLLTGFLVTNNMAEFGLIASIGNFSSALFASLQGIANYGGRMRATKELRDNLLQERVVIENKENSDLETAAGFTTEDLVINFKNGEELSFPNIRVNAGEKVLLTGDSGAGKSTLFKLILGEEKASDGSIKYFDANGKIVNPDLSEIGYLAQIPTLFPTTIVENITMFNDNLQKYVDDAVQKVQLGKDIAKFSDGLDTKICLNPLNVSGGQKQKIVLARSKVHQSKLILIDEGTSAIDQVATSKILQELVKTDATVVFIAHNLTDKVRQIFDREISLTK
ncbi:ATP-binding cassette domain-containing protein [Lactobacillus kalixensis]|nr:ABC transporter ATP-binding protein [Lactobacillus kalixensis]